MSRVAFSKQGSLLSSWGILVKLVICVYSGQLKIKMVNFMKYASFAWFSPLSNPLSLQNMMGNLIAPFIKLLYLIYGNSMSRGDIKKITQCVWQRKSIFSTQKNFQRHYMMLRCIFGINHFSFLRIWDFIFLFILAQLCLVSPWDNI